MFCSWSILAELYGVTEGVVVGVFVGVGVGFFVGFGVGLLVGVSVGFFVGFGVILTGPLGIYSLSFIVNVLGNGCGISWLFINMLNND